MSLPADANWYLTVAFEQASTNGVRSPSCACQARAPLRGGRVGRQCWWATAPLAGTHASLHRHHRKNVPTYMGQRVALIQSQQHARSLKWEWLEGMDKGAIPCRNLHLSQMREGVGLGGQAA